MKDFYLDDRALAAYVEKDWADRLLPVRSAFHFPAFDMNLLYSPYHEALANFVASLVAKAPRTYLEVGSALGRTWLEMCQRFSQLERATLIEPSENLSSTFAKIFNLAGEEPVTLKILRGHYDFADAFLPAKAIRQACADIEVSHLHQSYEEVDENSLGMFDLVVCSNVLDQCADPHRLVELLQNRVAPGGILVLSCTYQWSAKYLGNAPVRPIRDINDLFSSTWALLGETNLPFQVRVNERYWKAFLSHVVIWQSKDG